MEKGSLTLKQQKFCLEYVKDFNATQAAIRAGYSSRSAKSIGSENLTKPDVRNYLSGLFTEIKQESLLSTVNIVNVLVEIAYSDIGEVLGFNEKTGRSEVHLLNSHVKEIKKTKYGLKVEMHDKMRALELLCNYISFS